MINNNTIVSFTTQNSPLLASQHLVPCSRVIRFLYQPSVSQQVLKVIPRPQKMHATTQPKPAVRTPPHERVKSNTMLKMVSVELKRHGPNGGNKIKPTPSIANSLRGMKWGSPNTAEESKCTRLIAPFSESPTRAYNPEQSQHQEIPFRGTFGPIPNHISVIPTPASCGLFEACFQPINQPQCQVDITQLNHSTYRSYRKKIFSDTGPRSQRNAVSEGIAKDTVKDMVQLTPFLFSFDSTALQKGGKEEVLQSKDESVEEGDIPGVILQAWNNHSALPAAVPVE